MHSLMRAFMNFRDFYNEINAATLTGAIDVIVVEQPDGEFKSSPFHVRFGKLGVLRSREKVVDITINGEPVDIHMKLGEAGEAFFVEEISTDSSVDELPNYLTTSPIPVNYLTNKYNDDSLNGVNTDSKNLTASEDMTMPLPLPRRNSIDFTKELAKDENSENFENQVSDFSHRRHTDNTLERRNLSNKLKEYTTQKLRQELAEHEEALQLDVDVNDSSKNCNNLVTEHAKTTVLEAKVIEKTVEENATSKTKDIMPEVQINNVELTANNSKVEDAKNKKKRRKKTQMKKKNAQRKSSSSSSIGSNVTVGEGSNNGVVANEADADTLSLSASLQTNQSSNEDEAKSVDPALVVDKSELCLTSPITASPRIPELDLHFFSDTEITTSGTTCSRAPHAVGRPSSPIQSDSELEISKRDKEQIANTTPASWQWGGLPTSDPKAIEVSAQDAQAQDERRSMLSSVFNFMKRTKHGNDNGVYLADLDAGLMDAQKTNLYFPVAKESSRPARGTDEDRESGNGTSLAQSPNSMEGVKSLDSDYEDGRTNDSKYLDFVAMSLCGGLEKGDPTDEEFDKKLVTHADVCKDPSLFSSPNLVVRLNGKFYSWAAACPIVMTIITFQKPLSNEAVEQLMTNSVPQKEKPNDSFDANAAKKNRSWWPWGPRQSDATSQQNVAVHDEEKIKISEQQYEAVEESNVEAENEQTENTKGQGDNVKQAITPLPTPEENENSLDKTDSTAKSENTSKMVDNLDDLSQISMGSAQRYKKTTRLSSDVIKKLNLKEGRNEIEFSVTTAYQGTSRCKCCLFRWKHNDKIVISDIDGTITKSDVLGHILPMVGNNWAQIGVAQLFSKIEENGYKLLYLSSRSIGLSRATRQYLRSIRQGDVCLPDGPLLLNPTSLLNAVHCEVIERKPELFKISCLSDIRDLFPEKKPFYAGYGNRVTDVYAYRTVGIPIMRIFTINEKGELKHEMTQTFQSSYSGLTCLVDQMFPPIDEGSFEYSNFNYWRDPIQELDLDLKSLNETKNQTKITNGSKNNTTTKILSTIPEN